MAAHRAEPGSEPDRSLPDVAEGTVRLTASGPDPFRAAGVPERLVLVLHREGLFYVGTLSTWEYHEIVVSRRDGPGAHAREVREMVVDTSRPHTVEVVVRMFERPTAARLVAELVGVLRGMVSGLAGRDRRMPVPPAGPSRYASRQVVGRPAAAAPDRAPLYGVHGDDLG
jgi:hypothetical protein